jgi:serine phosphatase RsbU (regulator of sigma subunit)
MSAPAGIPPLESILPELGRGLAVAEQLEAVQREMDSLRGELNLLRRRDETLNFYMHRLDEELRLAARLQQDFLPRSLPQLGPVHFHTLFRPAGYVSGDLYDVMRLDEKHVGFYIADAVGHGMPAALLTMFIKHALVTKEINPGGYRLLDPGEALARLNMSILEQKLSAAQFATALYGIINVETLQVRLAKAGHPTPLIMRSSGHHEPFEAEGSLLGVFEGETFDTTTRQLHPGDSIFLYTDGLEVAFGEGADSPDRWREELAARKSMTPEALLADLSDHIDKEAGSLDPRDDLTLMVIEIKQ